MNHFSHPWETVAHAAWRKYPNPMNPAVIGTDVVDRKVVDGVLHTHRLVSSTWYFPTWAQSVCKNNEYLFTFRIDIPHAVAACTMHVKLIFSMNHQKT